MSSNFISILFLNAIFLLPVPESFADSDPTAPISLCSGWNSETHSWGLTGITTSTDTEGNCPKNHALTVVRFAGGGKRPASQYVVAGTCCELPAGALSEYHQYVEQRCDAESVVTGVKRLIVSGNSTDELRLRCSKINTESFTLGPVSSGLYTQWFLHLRMWFADSTTYARIPYALRIGAGRIAKFGWDRSLCVGIPWGALFTGRTHKYCHNHEFRQLFRKQDGGSVPAIDYERCLAVDDQYAEEPRCTLIRKDN